MTDQAKQPYPTANATPGSQVQPEYQAKQGRTGGRIFAILAVSIVLVVFALFGLWALNAGRLTAAGAHGSQAATQADARKFNAPEPSPRITSPTAP